MTRKADPAAPARRRALIDYRITICGLDELDGHAAASVSHVVSILDPDWPVPAVLTQYGELRQHWLLRFHDIGIEAADRIAPGRGDVEQIVAIARELTQSAGGGHALVHCHAGISRSTAATAILLAHANPGCEAEVFEEIVRLRPGAWPNVRMIDLADDLLACGGRLRAGLRALQEARSGVRTGGARRID